MGRKKGVQKPQAEISKIKHVQDEDMTLKLKEVIKNFQVSELLYHILKIFGQFRSYAFYFAKI